MIFLLIALAVLLIFYFYRNSVPQLYGWRKKLLIVLRSVAIIVILILLLNPVLFFIKHTINRPKVIMLNDISDSMNQESGDISKTDALQDFREIVRTEIRSGKYDIVNYDFAGEPGKNTTRLTPALQEITQKQNLEDIQAIFLFSDGWLKDESLESIIALNIPIYTVVPDFKINDFDLEITSLRYNKTVYRNDLTPIEVNLSSTNFNGNAKIELYIDNKKIKAKKIEFRDTDFLQEFFEISFNETGMRSFEVVVSSDSTNEKNPANNKYTGAIQVLRERSRITIISDKSGWDAKFMIDAIQQNPRWEHSFLLKEKTLKKIRQQVSLKDEIQETVMLILINKNSLQFTTAEAEIIKNFVKQGGGLFLMGKPPKEISEILPAADYGFRTTFESTFSFTDESKRYETFNLEKVRSNIPPVNYYFVKPKLQAKILAKIENEERNPAILFMNYEKGKVLQLAFLNLWKWQLWEKENKYNQFISNIISWLSRESSERFFARTNKTSYFSGEKITVNLTAYDETLSPIYDLNSKLTVFDKKHDKVFEEFLLAKEDVYQCEIGFLPSGNYSFQVIDERTGLETKGEFMVTADDPESRDRGFNTSLLAYIADQTNGKLYYPEDITEFEFPEAQLKTFKKRAEIPIYKKWYLIALFLFSFCLELYLRKRWGLL
ncbi:MAG: hypothetical protein ISS80_00735 [Candidatus Cloacimonetes bacterium]|nr:hypothetical protein [Candidatus Cloacimonadota bacterium]